MATLTVQVITRAGINPTYAAATGGGDQVTCHADTYLHVKNNGASPITVTLAIPAAASAWPQVSYTNTAVSVTNGQERIIGPIEPGIYADANGFCQITYSAVTSVTIGAFQNLEP